MHSDSPAWGLYCCVSFAVAAIMMGIGILTFGIGGIFVSNGALPLLIGMTIGAVLFAIGLITLIVGALIKALH